MSRKPFLFIIRCICKLYSVYIWKTWNNSNYNLHDRTWVCECVYAKKKCLHENNARNVTLRYVNKILLDMTGNSPRTSHMICIHTHNHITWWYMCSYSLFLMMMMVSIISELAIRVIFIMLHWWHCVTLYCYLLLATII